MSWLARFSLRMAAVLALMLLVEFASFLLYREQGLMRLYWIPLSYGLVALAGYDTVKRLPLVWGAAIGALLAGVASVLSWPIGAFVLDGALAFPEEGDPLIVVTGVLVAAIVGAIVAVVAGMLARDRRRHRSRREALTKLAYTESGEPLDPDDTVHKPVAIPMADRDQRH